MFMFRMIKESHLKAWHCFGFQNFRTCLCHHKKQSMTVLNRKNKLIIIIQKKQFYYTNTLLFVCNTYVFSSKFYIKINSWNWSYKSMTISIVVLVTLSSKSYNLWNKSPCRSQKVETKPHKPIDISTNPISINLCNMLNTSHPFRIVILSASQTWTTYTLAKLKLTS